MVSQKSDVTKIFLSGFVYTYRKHYTLILISHISTSSSSDNVDRELERTA